MCLLDLPVASMCQLHTHAHPVACSALLSCSRRWRRTSGVWRHYGRASQHAAAYAHAAQAATTNTNVLRSAGLAANGCTKHNTQKSYRSLLFLFLFNSFFSLLLLLLLQWKFGTWIISGIGHFVVGIFQKFHVFLYYFCICLRHGTHTLSHPICMTRGTVREIERERKSVYESVEPKTQTNSSSNKAQEITNI